MLQKVININKRKIVGYVRITKADKDGNVSIITQKNRITNFYNNVEIVKIYDRDVGKTAYVKDEKIDIDVVGEQLIATFDLSARPALREMLKDSKNNLFEELLITRYDRFSRSATLQRLLLLYLNRNNVEVTPTDDSKDRLVREITSVLSEEEPRRVSKRLNLTLKRKFDDGIIIGKLPYGYKWNKRKKEVLINEKEAEIVRKVFDMTIHNYNYKQICNALKIATSTYYNIIKNRVYLGEVVFRDKSKKGRHQAIITEEVFNEANKKINS